MITDTVHTQELLQLNHIVKLSEPVIWKRNTNNRIFKRNIKSLLGSDLFLTRGIHFNTVKTQICDVKGNSKFMSIFCF